MYGAGGLSTGVIWTGLSYFLLIYYNQVLGLPASWVGLALALALIVDAISDPLVGYLTDNSTSRLGRRHPYLYASLVPASLLYFLIWNPPVDLLSHTTLFLFLLVITIGLRVSLTLFDVPFNALVPDLTDDYDERTRMLAYKVSVNFILGALFTVAMYMIWLVPTPETPDGVLNAEGYEQSGAVGALLIFVSILISAVGTHKFIPHLSRSLSTASRSLRAFWRQAGSALSNRSLQALLLSSALGAIASGLNQALYLYTASFFWEFSNDEQGLILLANIPGAMAGYFLSSRYVVGRDKKKTLILSLTVAVGIQALPLVLRLFDLMPANGNPWVLYIVLATSAIWAAAFLAASTLTISMASDIVDEAQLKDGNRSEGIILSTQTLSIKAATAGGISLAGVILDTVSFPANASVGNVPSSTIFNYGLTFTAVSVTLYVASIGVLFLYRISRQSHLKTLAQLKQ